MTITVKGVTLAITQGDITKISVDAIVNAANEGLRGGGGVDGAIHRAGGPSIMAECRTIGRCPTGKAVITTGGNLPARFVIHTVGPVYSGTEEDARLLATAYRNSLAVAEENACASVAFPSISTGIYGYPIEKAVRVVFDTVLATIEAGTRVKEVLFVLFSAHDFSVYEEEMRRRCRVV